jgi:transposase
VEAYDGPQIVGMELHRRRPVLVRMAEDGRKLATARIANSPARLTAEIRRAGLHPKVVLEACYGWYWAADTLATAGAEVHLAHPLGVEAFSHRRVKNDELDARDLAGSAAEGTAGGGVDRAAGDPRAAGDHPVSRQAGAAAHQGCGCCRGWFMAGRRAPC